MKSYEFKFKFIVDGKDGLITSDVKMPIGIEQVGPEQAKIAQIVAAYALHLAGSATEVTGGDYDFGVEESIRKMEKFDTANFKIGYDFPDKELGL